MDSHFYNVDVNDLDKTLNEIIKDLDGWLKWEFT
jgi:hypothetical protein